MWTRHPRRTALILFVASASAATAWVLHDYRSRPVMVLGPMLQDVRMDGFSLTWSVHPYQPATVRLMTSDKQLASVEVMPDAQGLCKIRFDSLSPAIAYTYEIVTGPIVLARHETRTAPADDRPIRFLALGDTGTGGWSQYRVAEKMPTWHPDLILHTGDLIYPRGRLEDNARKFYQPYAALLARVPIYVALGNHEYRIDEPLARSFSFPANGPPGDLNGNCNYWFDFGPARFVMLDSNNDEHFFRDHVAPWLEPVLASASGRWKIVVFHEPIYTNGKYPPAVKLLRTIVPLIDRYRVELVLHGHNHMYERTRPIRNGEVVSPGEGTVYITTGAGGANLAKFRMPVPPTIVRWNDREHSFTVVDVGRDRMFIRQVNKAGEVFDETHIPRQVHADVAICNVRN